jgi:hypothetical protein
MARPRASSLQHGGCSNNLVFESVDDERQRTAGRRKPDSESGKTKKSNTAAVSRPPGTISGACSNFRVTSFTPSRWWSTGTEETEEREMQTRQTSGFDDEKRYERLSSG